MSVRPIFAWYDLWVGAFWDSAKRRLYIFPVPMLGVVIDFRTCANHRFRASRVNLDGDELCQECATAWARGEGEHAAWLEAQDADGAF